MKANMITVIYPRDTLHNLFLGVSYHFLKLLCLECLELFQLAKFGP